VPSRHLLEHRSVTLDLSAIKSADPFGLVYLAIYVGKLIEYEPLRLSINLGRGAFARHLNRMGVLDVLRRDTRVRVESGTILPEFFGKGSNPRILELEQHTVADEDAAEALSERLLDIIVLKRRRDLLARSELFQTALLEIIANVSVHSGARQVYVAAAAVNDRIHLAIGDSGMGIPARLKKSGIAEKLSCSGAIIKALEPGVSTRVGRGGLGLTTVSDQVREHGSYMAIRSGDGEVVIRGENTTGRDNYHVLPGTMVEIAW